MNNLKICNMILEDYEQIKDNLISDFDDFWTPSILKSELMGENKTYIVAKQENNIVGFAGMMANYLDIEIMNIVVKKSERGKGIGKFLLDKLIEIAKNNQFENIILEVNENNIIAKKMYENAGFMQIGMRKKYYQSTENAILMSKKVNNL